MTQPSMITYASNSNFLSLQVRSEDVGMRLDQWLAKAAEVSRTKAQKALCDGQVHRGAQLVQSAKYRVLADEVYTIHLQHEVEYPVEAQPMPLDIVYEDEDLIVLNKPAGLVVHPGAGNRDATLINGLLAHCGAARLSGVSGLERPGIVHRLDKDTSGLLVVAKNDRVHLALQQQFEQRTIERCYHALVWGMVTPSTGKIERKMMRHPRHPQRMVTTDSDRGRYALTRYRLMRHFTENASVFCSLIVCALATGRTHQIRVHCHHFGHPLVGDSLYGRRRQAGKSTLRAALIAFPRQALCAKTLGFHHPIQGVDMRFEIDIPTDFATLLAAVS